MGEVNMIFGGSMSIASKTQGKKLEREISQPQCIEPERMMRWSDIDISFGLQDHPDTELYDKNLPFVVKLPIGRHKVTKTVIDNGDSVDLIMRKTFIKMGLNLKGLNHVHDMFHRVIPGQSSTPIRRIDLKVSCGTDDNKHKEVLTFEVASFDIGYNCILKRPFLLKYMAVIHTAYTTLKMSGPKGVITIKANQRDALACENSTLTHAGRFSKKQLRNRQQRWQRRTVVAHHSSHWCPSHRRSPTPDLRRPRRVQMAPQRPTSNPLINRQTGRRRRLMTKKSQSTLAT
jgi:hypothetical protein